MAYQNYSLNKYLAELSKDTPVPGGGSVAALVAACGVSLICMAANYSKGKSPSKAVNQRLKNIVMKSKKIKKDLLLLVDLDAKVYLEVVRTRSLDSKAKSLALKKARDVPLKVCRLCYQAIGLTPFLVKKGNRNLLSDVQIAIELLLAAFNSSLINVRINQ